MSEAKSVHRKRMPNGGKNREEHTPVKESMHQQLEKYRCILDSICNGVMVTDADGYITHFNKPYGEFLGIDHKAQIGKHCTDVIENTRMHIVAKTGKPEINRAHQIKGQSMVVQRIPIKKSGKIIAVFGQVMFKDIQDVGKLAKKLSLLESKVEHYEQELMSLRSTRYTLDSIVGGTKAIKALKKEALRAAATNFPVMISGESGTGKELFAQGIHHASPRKLHPFIRINCSAIPKDLLESELFGYEKGAFTGAKSEGKPGKFELAQHGTVFLDEIGDLPLHMQPKLLRVLEDKEFERIGGTRVLQSDFRLIAATNQNLEAMLAERRFRKDLFYRLNVIPLNIPPLRERRDDIPLISKHLLKQLSEEAALSEIRIDKEADKVLRDHDWPGNIRELRNILERVLFSLDGDTIYLRDLPFYLYRSRGKTPANEEASLKEIQANSEKEAIQYALVSNNYKKATAAKMLGIHRTLLYKKMKKYGIPLDLNGKNSSP